MSKSYLAKATELAKEFIRKTIKKGDIVVDATVGNGNDTLFLYSLVSDNGKIYGFDIQNVALENTKRKFEGNNYFRNIYLINDGHENMDNYIEEEVSAIMFNLGYLPGYNHEITTKCNTTIEGISKGLEILKRGGIITIVLYPGHIEGAREKEEILIYLSEVDQKKFNILKIEFINQRNNPPMLIVIEKII